MPFAYSPSYNINEACSHHARALKHQWGLGQQHNSLLMHCSLKLTNLVLMQKPSSPTRLPMDPVTAQQQHKQPSTSQAAPPEMHRPSASRLARVNTTVSKTVSPDRAQTRVGGLQNGHNLDDPTDRKAAASSALSQLLQSDTQPSTGTPMARDLTEALTALASNKRLMSSMQASRSFSSPDLLSLAQQLHDSGQWTAVQDMVQQEEKEEEQHAADQGQASARSGHDNYGTVVGRPHKATAEGQGGSQLRCVTHCQSTCSDTKTFNPIAVTFHQPCHWTTAKHTIEDSVTGSLFAVSTPSAGN